MNTQLRQCFARAKPFWLKKARNSQILSGFFISKKAKVLQKARISKSSFEKTKLATLVVIPKQHREKRETISILNPAIILPYFGWLITLRCVCVT